MSDAVELAQPTWSEETQFDDDYWEYIRMEIRSRMGSIFPGSLYAIINEYELRYNQEIIENRRLGRVLFALFAGSGILFGILIGWMAATGVF